MSHVRAHWPWWTHQAFRGGGRSRGLWHHGAVVSSPPGRLTGRCPAMPRGERRGPSAPATAGLLLLHVRGVTPPRPSSARNTARSSHHRAPCHLLWLCPHLPRQLAVHHPVESLGHLLDPLYLTRCPMKLCPNRVSASFTCAVRSVAACPQCGGTATAVRLECLVGEKRGMV